MPTNKYPFPPTDTWQCTKCDEVKPLADFRKNRSCKYGRTQKCIACTNKYVNTYQNTDKGKKILRNAGLKYKYGIDTAEYNKLLESQNGGCAICGDYPPVRHKKNGTVRFLDVDHNHTTNQVRGLLCMYCNRGLGYLRTAAIMERAVKYLRERGEYTKS